jgi:hypothetical protein
MSDRPTAPSPNELTPQEERLIGCAERGEWWLPHDFPVYGPPTAAQDAQRTIRADVIRCLITTEIWLGKGKSWPVSPKGLMAERARISGSLDLEGATLNRTLWLFESAFDDPVNLMDAESRTVGFSGSNLPYGFNAHRSKINGSLLLNGGFTANGEVNLASAKIEGTLACDNGHFKNANGLALRADALTVGASVFLRDGFSAIGGVNLVSAKIEGQLDCTDGHFENTNSPALQADSIIVGADVFLRNGFSAKGEVNFIRAEIHGNMRCERSMFSNEGGDAIKLTHAEIGAGLFIQGLRAPEGDRPGLSGRLILVQAKCLTFSDNRASWPEAGKLVLDGFSYERFHDCEVGWEARQEWLGLQKPEHLNESFRPQPWTQAVKVLRDMGHDDDARELAFQRESMRERSKATRRIMKLWLGLLRISVGYGYKPQRALYWSLGFMVSSWIVFACAANLGYMAPRDGSVQAMLAVSPGHSLPDHYTRFNAAVYAFDSYMPIIELGQDQAWEPSDSQTGHRRDMDDGWWAETVRLALGHDWTITGRPTAGGASSPGLLDYLARAASWLFNHGFHRLVYWTLVVFGWAFISLLIAAMSGIVIRKE